MRHLWKYLAALMVIALLLSVGALAEGSPLVQETATLERGSRMNLRSESWEEKLTWSSSDQSVAKVSSKGVVSGRRAGVAIITAQTDTRGGCIHAS